ncbi:MAG TPA: zinc-binding alcohol dehydrogenase family protein [Acidobacteriaceae bacterium]|nr:zinc-binding alcohol dehydrogenase family protein [Acidobacteriaceae bacterium]
MKQIVLEAPGRFVERQAPMPVPNTGEAFVRVQKVGVCGSDFHAFAGRHPAYSYPRVLGHELSGIVVEAPANDKGIQAGDSCAIEPYLACGKCPTCSMGRENCCEQLKLFGVHIDGGMQEFLSVPINLLHKSEKLSLDQLALVETLGIGAHAVDRSGLRAGEEALVVGAGPIGISVAQFAAALGAKVRLVETVEWRRQFVEAMGYEVLEAPDGRLADAVFDATGNARAMAASLSSVAAGGRLIFAGLTADPVCIDDALLHRREITLYASRNSYGLFPGIIRLIESGKIDASHWITDRLTLSNVVSDFQRLPELKTVIKAMVDVQDQA